MKTIMFLVTVLALHIVVLSGNLFADDFYDYNHKGTADVLLRNSIDGTGKCF
ncbi:hypothetical protein ACFLZ5_05195 [Thermodesulfobacteriota bacterium]